MYSFRINFAHYHLRSCQFFLFNFAIINFAPDREQIAEQNTTSSACVLKVYLRTSTVGTVGGRYLPNYLYENVNYTVWEAAY